MTILGAGLVIGAIVVAAIGLIWALPVNRVYRTRRVVTCPATGIPVAAELDAEYVARSAWLGPVDLRVRDCEGWPDRAGCEQTCLDQIEAHASFRHRVLLQRPSTPSQPRVP